MFRQLCICCTCFTERRAGICDACSAELPWLGHACRVCAIPLVHLSAQMCGPCSRGRLPIERSNCLFHYAAPINRLITRFKFHADLTVGHHLAHWFAEKVKPDILPDAIIPMPLHPARLRQRGFNQALELVKPIALQLGVPVLADSCKRVVNTPDQIGLSALQRRRNMRNAFICTPKQPLPAHVAVFDDVVTTGATVLSLVRTLRRAGVQRLDVWALARATGRIAQSQR